MIWCGCACNWTGWTTPGARPDRGICGGPAARACVPGGPGWRAAASPAREALERAIIGKAADLLSGPGGLASFLRTWQLGARLAGPSLPLGTPWIRRQLNDTGGRRLVRWHELVVSARLDRTGWKIDMTLAAGRAEHRRERHVPLVRAHLRNCPGPGDVLAARRP
jgi:hypothetical protein